MPESIRTNRGMIKFWFLGLITAGIYCLFFWHGYARDVNILCSEDGKHTPGLTALILLSIITLGIYPFVWKCKAQNRLRAAQKRQGLMPSQRGGSVVWWNLLGLVIFVGPFVALHIQCKTINQVAYAYNMHPESRPALPGGGHCPGCHRAVNKGDLVCPHCDRPLKARGLPPPPPPHSTCPHCGSSVNKGDRVCPHCDRSLESKGSAPPTPLPPHSSCPHCGSSVRKGDRVCPHCGRSLESRVLPPSPPPPPPPHSSCPNCGSSVALEDRICPYCGTALHSKVPPTLPPPAHPCRHCGQRVAALVGSCPHCNQPLESPFVNHRPKPAPEPNAHLHSPLGF